MDENIPQLTLDPVIEPAPVPEVAPVTDLAETRPEAGADLSALSEAEQKAVHDFAEKIDLHNSQQILQYGVAAQKNVSDFSDAALSSVRTKDMGQVGDMIGSLLVELKGFDAEEEKKGLFGMFRKAGRSIEVLKTKYEKAEVNVDKIAAERSEERRVGKECL